MRLDRLWRLMCLAWALAGCAGSLDNPEDFAFLLDGGGATVDGAPPDDDAGTQDAGGSGDVPSCVTDAFTTGCGTTACHGAGGLQVDLESPGLAGRLVDQPSVANGACADRVYIATDDAPSLLLQKLSTASDCGSPMPLGRAVSEAWDQAQYECVEAWVLSLGGTALGATP